MMSLITVKHLRKEFPNVTPLKDINIEINKGDVISIIGPSGTGKSTFLRCLNQLETPTSGEIYFHDKNLLDNKANIYEARKKMGMVFQSFNIFANKTILENIMQPPVDLLGLSKEQARAEAMELLETVGLLDKAENYSDELSGGQKQRVAIARTIAMHPEVVLFDEPTSALDPTMVGEVLSVIRRLAGEGLTMLIVTHEMKFAKDVSNRVFYMDEGIIYEEGSPTQIFNNPIKEKTRRFINRLKVFTLEINSKHFDFIGVNTQIQKFGVKQLITPKQILKLQQIFEEICIVNVIEQIPEKFNLKFEVEFSEEKNQCNIVITYDGEKYNPLEEGEEFSIKIALMNVDKATFSYVNGNNKISMTIL